MPVVMATVSLSARPAPNLLPPPTIQVTLLSCECFIRLTLWAVCHVTTGGRGCLRELWNGITNLDTIRDLPRAINTSIQERLFRISTLSTPEFGEEFSLGQRFSGFFVPPKSSLYTFNLRSDDLARLFLSPNASSQFAEHIITNWRHTQFR